VYNVQDWAEVHRLFHRESWSKTAIAEKLHMSRNTVDRLLDRVKDIVTTDRLTRSVT
jgi:DNA-binding transcriptional regulator LsrR (DeoR family)